MSIKQKSTFAKREFEYESPDGDKYNITYVEHEDREYVEIASLKDDGSIDVESKVVWDVKMLEELINTVITIKNKINPNQHVPSTGLSFPKIIDHRTGSIEKAVQNTMQRYDDSVKPVESFDVQKERDSWQENATGISRESEPTVGQTPEEISLNKSELKDWQKDVINRKSSSKTSRPSIRKVNAGDLI